jgi:SSS family solute:Na+ symporter
MLDIHKKYFNPNLSEKNTVWIGRIAIVVAFAIALVISPQLKNLGQAYEYIQKYTGYISPGILSIFLLGFFWKKNSTQGAIVAAVLSIILSTYLEIGFPDMPFLNRMGIAFWICVLVQVAISYLVLKGEDHPNAFEVKREWFKVTKSFQLGAIAIIAFFIFIYVIFW